jgi:hypothetical protein
MKGRIPQKALEMFYFTLIGDAAAIDWPLKRLGNLSAADRFLQMIHIQIAAGHDHDHFLARQPVSDFAGCYQRNSSR